MLHFFTDFVGLFGVFQNLASHFLTTRLDDSNPRAFSTYQGSPGTKGETWHWGCCTWNFPWNTWIPNTKITKLFKLEVSKAGKIGCQAPKHIPANQSTPRQRNTTNTLGCPSSYSSNSDHKHQHHHLVCRWYLFPFNHCLVRRVDNPTNTGVSTQGRTELARAPLVT